MKFLRLLFPLLILPIATALAQQTEPPDGTPIIAAEVSGLDPDRLSPGLREEIGRLAGSPLNRQRLREIAARIEAEQPQYVAGVRASQDPDGAARVVFVVARVQDPGRETNINARYVVEDVDIRGVRDSEVGQELRAELQALTGRPLDSDEADRLETRLREALPEYDVRRRTMRGSAPGRIRVIFEATRAEWARWLHFEPQEANAIYHSKQGWGANLPLSVSGRHVHVSPTLAIDIGDELIEEYSGFALRVESRRLGTERLGLVFEWSTFDQTWRDATLSALALNPRLPAAYRNRMTVTPLLKFAIAPGLSVAGGVRITELDALGDADDSRMANAAIGALTYSRRSKPGPGPRHDVEAGVIVRAGTDALESDLVYERYLGHAGYSFRQANHEVRLSAMTGGISGDAPLFERFSLGDSRTLRGWHKYDIAPAGGDRMVHTSLEYQFRGVGAFLDAGAVWDDGADRRLRVSTGVTINPGPVFLTVGFPVNTGEFGAVFTMGFRFPTSLMQIRKY